jgi:delta14-sterol reductase
MDIVTDGFGFMLSIGDLCWVPFTYTLQARYLAFHPTELSPVAIAGVLAVQAAGYYIFRASNSEKNDFRNGKNPKGRTVISPVEAQNQSLTRPLPSPTGLTSMQTKRGTKLLTSGWWGWSRHPNYFGDLIMAYVFSTSPLSTQND